MELTPSSVDVADALTQILPVDTAERLADHLTPADVATLRDLVRAAVPANTLRAVASDLAYLEAWHVASTGFYLAWPPSDAAALSFIAHHLFRPAERAVRGDGYGMPKDTEAELRAAGVLRGALPHAPATVSRRLSSWRRVAQTRGCENALTSSAVRQALSAATKASERQKGRHSQMSHSSSPVSLRNTMPDAFIHRLATLAPSRSKNERCYLNLPSTESVATYYDSVASTSFYASW